MEIRIIKYCRSAHFMKTHDGNEFTPWNGIKIDLKSGLLLNKPTRESKRKYLSAKNQDKVQRKRNYIANKENKKALERYRKAGGDTSFARGRWITENGNSRWVRAQEGLGTENINWDMIPVTDVFRHRNATLRSNIIEHYGMNKIIADLDYEIVDIDIIDGRKYKLLDVTIPDFSQVRRNGEEIYKGLYLEMINPSTGESHFEGVANTGTWNGLKEATVKAALSWRDGDNILTSGQFTAKPVNSDSYIKPEILT